MNTILSAHQPGYLPWLGYFHKMALCDDFVILDDVQFEKNSFTNRNKIKTANGPIWLTVPLLTAGHTQKTISGMEINSGSKWKDKHFRSIYFNYKNTPYFSSYSDFFEDFYRKDWKMLSDALDYMLLYFVKELGIETRIHKQNRLGIKSKKQQLILDLCSKFKSDIFVFGALGSDYADVSSFNKEGIDVYFQDYHHPEYAQLWGEFVPRLSIIDLLFNVGSGRAMEIIMSGNVTIEEIRKKFA